MGFYLTFGFGQKAQVPIVAEFAGNDTNSQRASVPEWVEEALATAQFAEPPLGPVEVLGFLPSRLLERLPRLRFIAVLATGLMLVSMAGTGWT